MPKVTIIGNTSWAIL